MTQADTQPIAVGRRVYTIREFGEMFAIGRSTIYSLIGDGQLRPAKISGKTVFTAREVDRFAATLDGDGRA